MTEPTFSDSWPILYVHEVHPADQYREADQEEIVRHPEFDDLRKENALLRAEVNRLQEELRTERGRQEHPMLFIESTPHDDPYKDDWFGVMWEEARRSRAMEENDE